MLDEEDIHEENFDSDKLNALLNRISFALNPTDNSRDSSIAEMKTKTVKGMIDACADLVKDNITVGSFFVIPKSATTFVIAREITSEEFKALPKRSFLFLNIPPDKLTEDSIKNLIHFEIGPNPLAYLYAVSNEIFVPVLQNPMNQNNWTDLISKDLMEKLNNFNANMYLTLGQMNGETLLPLPPTRIMESKSIFDKDKADIFNNSIITWMKQIRKVLDTEPEQNLKNGNPGPELELEFWQKKSENLNSIHKQLKSETVLLILKTLRESKSTYASEFEKQRESIKKARDEANDTYMYLRTLNGYFKELKDTNRDFKTLHTLFMPIMKVILLIWERSVYYNKPARLVVLIREICNAIIEQANMYVPGREIIRDIQNKDEVMNACIKLQETIDVCGKFKEAFFHFKSISKSNPGGGWGLPMNALFIRLDSFLERCHDIMHIAETILQFNKLENIQIGGTKGKNLSITIKQIYNQFNDAVRDFNNQDSSALREKEGSQDAELDDEEYDIMDIARKSFDDHFFQFRNRIKDLERRLAAVITQSFDDMDTLSDKFRLLDSFDELLKRPIIQDELEKKHIALIEAYKKDLKTVQEIFVTFSRPPGEKEKKMDEQALYKNLPPYAGTISWTRSLKGRISSPLDKLEHVSPDIKEKEEFKDVVKMKELIENRLTSDENTNLLHWMKSDGENARQKLDNYLLVKDESLPTLRVNFDPSLISLLREVKYLKMLGDVKIPESAEEVYSKSDTYRRQINKLDQIVEKYNFIVTKLEPVEEPLIENKIKKLKEDLTPFTDTYKWKSADIDSNISGVTKSVNEVFEIVEAMKTELDHIRDKLNGLITENKQMLDRKNKSVSPEDFLNEHVIYHNIQSEKIKKEALGINKKIGEITLKIVGSGGNVGQFKKKDEYIHYTEFINDIVIDGLCKAICTSLNNLNNLLAMDKASRPLDYQPLFDVKLNIPVASKSIQYEPEISDPEDPKSIRGIINTMVTDYVKYAGISRVDTGGNSGDYINEMHDSFEIRACIAEINSNVDLICMKTEAYKGKFEIYNMFWIKDPKTAFQEFLVNELTPAQIAQLNDPEREDPDKNNPIMKDVTPQTRMPAVDAFGDKIEELKRTKKDILQIESQHNIEWLKINTTPLRNSLEDRADQWINQYTDFFNKQVNTFILNCHKFMKELTEGTSKKLSDFPNDQKLMRDTMELLAREKVVSSRIVANAEFMRRMIIKLKDNEAERRDPVLKPADGKVEDFTQMVDNIVTNYDEIERKLLGVKNDIIPLKEKEVTHIKERIEKFSSELTQFRNEFLKQAPFDYNKDMSILEIEKSYDALDAYYLNLVEFREKAKELNYLETLFELEVKKYKQIDDCQTEIEKLKRMWDTIAVIRYTYESWLKVPWKKMNVAEYSEDNQKFIEMLKKVPREVKLFKGFNAITDEVANMKKTIECISQLSGNKLEKRHWQTLSNIVGSQVDEGAPGFCFESMVKIGINNYVAQVVELEETATKEATISKTLSKIQKDWKEKAFQFEDFPLQTEVIKIFKQFEEIQNDLSFDNLKVLNLLNQGRSVEIFATELTELRDKLAIIDECLLVWEKVQKNWKRLVNIFSSSDDIRNQMPEASKVFDKNSGDFKNLMAEAYMTPIMFDICTVEKKEELDTIHKNIEYCEKELNTYLEGKKKLFPRFYFVSNQTLIDILSSGNNPVKIATEALGDLFDGLKKLVLCKYNEGDAIIKAEAMHSKDGEIVNFHTPFETTEVVEGWLANLEFKMRSTLEAYLIEAKHNADKVIRNPEVPDDEKLDWIFKYNYCAQIALLVIQIIWTEDVHLAFEGIEGGMSNAMKDCLAGINQRISRLISMVRGKLSPNDRNKIITIITVDVHSRDAVQKLIDLKITDKENFQWGSQLKFFLTNDLSDIKKMQKLRFEWEHSKDRPKAIIKIVDWNKFYSYEYIGNCGRLVITPLTDRCYITLTQALGLCMGGAPAGPAGTGKTETTKDLGRGVGLAVFVFNCSEQMSTDSLGQNFMGLAQTGAWGCFDEFNRISIEVLSVVSTQVKQIQDALKTLINSGNKDDKFFFMDEEITIVDTVGLFITMNPGYAGRTELPESLKALFRSCAMVVPELVLICENMLMSEGYESAKELAKKFVTLYTLSKSLLSNQKHYDWGLRAIKSVLRQAGKLKRDPKNSHYNEKELLMRSLRDFNMPKIYSEDKSIFINLLKDLFKGVEEPPVATDEALEKSVGKVAERNHLIPDKEFCTKCVQLSEILEVRHCVFVIGPPGSGKSTVWQTLLKTYQDLGQDTAKDCLDPKAVSSNELFGVLNSAKEFKSGVLSSIIRNQSKEYGKYKATVRHKWSILDGDIDPEWIESLNTVMDDNKVLTLVSNDRFPLSPSMRLIFEISNLKNATLATVTRAGVLYINESDIGWKPYFDSWLHSHRPEFVDAMRKTHGQTFRKPVFDTKAESTFMKCFQQLDKPDVVKLNRICPIVEMQLVQTTCAIIDELVAESIKSIKDKDETQQKAAYEGIFYYAAMWAYGGSIVLDGNDENKKSFNEFDKLWRSRAKIQDVQVEQANGMMKNRPIYDFYWNVDNLQWEIWEPTEFQVKDEVNFLRIFVPTVGTQRLKRLIELHVANKKPILFVGSAGTGKTAVVNQYLNSIQGDPNLTTYTTNFSSKTSSASLQESIMGSGIKKLGQRLFGLGNKTMVFFIDDMNMPYVDKYGTQSPIALLRQISDYGIVYDRENLEEHISLQDLYFCGCMNPKAGSFNIELRLQRHFSLFAVSNPDETIIKEIYKKILDGFYTRFKANTSTSITLADRVVDASMKLFEDVLRDGKHFSPTAQKFHYQFNLRDLSRITEGMMMGTTVNYNDNLLNIFKLWVHECRRVFEDRMIYSDDAVAFQTFLKRAFKEKLAIDTQYAKENFEDEIFGESNIFTTFIAKWEVMDDKFYLPINSKEQLKKCLQEKLTEYNEEKTQMNLVLFWEACQHICRIARIIERPAGNALLVGVGGSGKQSLTKLAAFLQEHELDSIKVTSNFNVSEFKTYLLNIYKKVTKPPGVMKTIMATDAQLANETILIYINEILNSGYISGLCDSNDLESQLLAPLKNEAKMADFKNPLPYFVEKIKKNLHVCLCMSPVGETLRIRARRFPGIVNQTQIDWFHSWPQTALYDVAYNFLEDMPLPEQVNTEDFDIRKALAENISETHILIDKINQDFFEQERRRNYTTPTSFLELIAFYKSSFSKNIEKIENQIISLQKSLVVLKETDEQVAKLKIELERLSKIVSEKSKDSNIILEEVNARKADAEEEQRLADIEQQKTNKAKQDAEKAAADANEKFQIAKPMQDKAQKALESLDEKSIGEMGKYNKPVPAILLTGRALLYLLDRKKVDLYNEKAPEKEWGDVQKMMKDPRRFKGELLSFSNKEAKTMSDAKKDYIRPLLANHAFSVGELEKGSKAAGNLCEFVHSIVGFSDAYQIVAPLEAESKRAQEKKEAAMKELEIVIQKVEAVKARVAELEIKLNAAMAEKQKWEDLKNQNELKMQNAGELVSGLRTNKERWTEDVKKLQGETLTAIGDSLLAAEFVGYIGPFSAKFREMLWKDLWLPKITEKKIPISEGVAPLKILTNKEMIAKWKNENLPEDTMSIENAAIITNSNRWPLVIDPQLQGGAWITGHVANPENFKKIQRTELPDGREEIIETSEQLLRISLNGDKWEQKLEEAIQSGKIVMLENVTADIDPLLDPLLSRSFIYKKGSPQKYVMLAKEEPTYYHRDFRLYLQCKLINPVFKPETSAQCTIINFIVTEDGLEEQLLAHVVDIERPELERTKIEIMRKMNQNAVQLAELDTRLLNDLAQVNPATILDDIALIQTLNETKKTSKQIEEDDARAKITEEQINLERSSYKPVASEGAMLYFLIISLNAVNHMYQYSLESFNIFFDKGIHSTEAKGADRIGKMVFKIRRTIYEWISRGLFERHKIIFLTMMTFRLMTKGQLKDVQYTDKELQFLLNCQIKLGQENPVKDWLKGAAWNYVLRLADLNGFEKLPDSLGNEQASRFKDWYSDQNPEIAPLPPSWKFVNQNPFKKLLILRALRPDRMIPALKNFIRVSLPEGESFVSMDSNNSFSQILSSTFGYAEQEGQLNTPIFFILSSGADPVRDVEILGESKNFTAQRNNFFNISLGQGQDIIANQKLEMSYKEGFWIMLQNIHLMPSWLPTFDKILDKFTKEGGASNNFRLFMSAEPSNDIPISILEKCIKLTNEPPTGLKANVKRAWTYFKPEEINDKDIKIKAVIFGLCYFHSVLIERRKFGPKGWNMFYPFNIGDLRDSARVLENIDPSNAGRLPWDDFKYIFGEIMYGGHIVDDWDRRLCSAYLEGLMEDNLLSEEFELLPYAGDKFSFRTPAPSVDHEKFRERIDTALAEKETPMYYGLHPNAEINLGTVECTTLFDTLVMLQPQGSQTTSKAEENQGEKVEEKNYMTCVLSEWTLNEKILPLEDIREKVSDSRGPYQNVFLQECEYMNYLLEEIYNDMIQLQKAKNGELTYSEKLENLEKNLNLHNVPPTWAALAYPAKRKLGSWFDNLLRRIEQLSTWKDDPVNIPRVTRINLLFNPQSFLTAIKQESKKDDLNKLYISTEFQKKTLEQIEMSAKDGAYTFGFLLDGASWDIQAGMLEEARPKEMFSHMPVCLCRSVKMPEKEAEDKTLYQCPTYRTEMRGNTYIFTAQLRSPKYETRKWILAGVALILDVEGESDIAIKEKDDKK